MRLLLPVFLALFFTKTCFAFSLTFDQTDTGSIAVSSNPVTPTKILNNNPAINATWIINYSTNNVFLVGPSTTSIDIPAIFSISLTTGTFYLPRASTATWSPDGETGHPYRGPMWAVSQGTGGSVIMRARIK